MKKLSQNFFHLSLVLLTPVINLFVYFFGGLECVGHCFAYVAHFVFLRDAWFRAQRAAVTSRRATNLATHLSNFYFQISLGIFEKFKMAPLGY